MCSQWVPGSGHGVPRVLSTGTCGDTPQSQTGRASGCTGRSSERCCFPRQVSTPDPGEPPGVQRERGLFALQKENRYVNELQLAGLKLPRREHSGLQVT